MITLSNDRLTARIDPKGAELTSLFSPSRSLEYIWEGDPAFWGKHSPVLFPIVGALKNDTFYFQEKPYHLPRHGFARDKVFEAEQVSERSALLSIASHAETLEKYPFLFRFSIRYALEGERLNVGYLVENTGEGPMYFSVGGHPAFRVPLTSGSVYEDYYLEFSDTENTGRWPVSPEGLIEASPEPLLDDTRVLPLTKELFSKDALVLKKLRSSTVKLLSDKTSHGLEFDFTGFPYLGLWAAGGADFVCIEPWYGIADSVLSDQQLTDKEGINFIAAGESFECTWSVTVF